jgi:GR25 family glycosyltransferase involved in LPS biosynthesis
MTAALDIRLINLDRSIDRLAAFQVVNKHMMPHVTRFPAIDGKNVERATFVERGIIAPDLGYKDGALGNALSQIELWDTAIREDRTLTICEDDAIFNRSFCAASEAVL